jgi:small subunit ribosomal protein S7
MPRRREVPKREILPDPLYNSQLVTKFINVLMKDGKKTTAERIVYDAFTLIGERSEDDPVKVFKKAVENVKPTVEVKSRRVGGSTYQVPIEVRPNRRLALSFRWLIQAAKSRGEKTMREKLAGEFAEAAENRGSAIKKKDDTHRMAEANKAFAHYRW